MSVKERNKKESDLFNAETKHPPQKKPQFSKFLYGFYQAQTLTPLFMLYGSF